MRFVDTYLEECFNSRYYSYLREFTWRYTCCRDHVVVWSRAIGILSPFSIATQKFN